MVTICSRITIRRNTSSNDTNFILNQDLIEKNLIQGRFNPQRMPSLYQTWALVALDTPTLVALCAEFKVSLTQPEHIQS